MYFYGKICGDCVYCIRMSRILTYMHCDLYCYRQ